MSDYFKEREFMSNLTGESGELVVTKDGAYLWTDGRYFLQAEQQLAGTEIELMRMAEPGVPTVEEFLADLAKNGGYVELALPSAGALTPVKRDQLLARVIDPKTFQVLEELRSPCDGMIFYGCRNYMVRPGGWVFGVANMEHDCSKWVGAD